MKIYTRLVWQWQPDGKLVEVPEETTSFEYDGPVAQCGGGPAGKGGNAMPPPSVGRQNINNPLNQGLAQRIAQPQISPLMQGRQMPAPQFNPMQARPPDTLQRQNMLANALRGRP
jgi:hypothetical protein